MAYRLPPNQSLHDSVITIAANNLRNTNQYNVYVNPGQQHNTSIGNHYPDIILTPINSNNVQFIIEVETADSINVSEAIIQWKPYSTLGGTFYLLVPQAYRDTAFNICRQYGIQVKFATYSIDNNNNLTIYYEQ